MEAYSNLSKVYDVFMDNVDYKKWGKYLYSLLKEFDINEGLILDLGCGTGNICEYLSGKKYDMIGVDNSSEMLSIAQEKNVKLKKDILYLNQDMRDFELYGTVRAVISNCDSLNYITNLKELIKVFKLVNNYLDPKGIFIFDMNTGYKYEKIGDSVIAENREETSFIWENSYNKKKHLNRYDLTLFLKEEDDLYRKKEEVHIQKAYSIDEVKSALMKSGLEFVNCYDCFTKEEPRLDSERLHFIARENGKEI